MGPCLARWTRCSGVNSQNFRVGSGGRSIWPGLGWLSGPRAAPVWEAPGKEAALFGSKLGPRGILAVTPMLDFWDACARQADRASHNPPAASSAAIATNRCFVFIIFCFDSASHSLWLRHCARISVVGFRFGTKAGNSGAKRQRAGMNPTPFEMALTNSTMLSGRKCPIRPRFHPGNLVRRDEFQTILGAASFSTAASPVVGTTGVACGRGANLPCAKPKDCPGYTTRSPTGPTPDTREESRSFLERRRPWP